MLDIIHAAGWPIYPIIACSILGLAIIIERTISLRRRYVVPRGLLARVLEDYKAKGLDLTWIEKVESHSPLGRILAAGLRNVNSSRDLMKESIEEVGRGVAHKLDRFLPTLGTIAAVSPLMGLLGTVIGMIEIFGSQDTQGTDPAMLARGISIALYNTAFGIVVAIPTLIAYRHFRSKVEGLLVDMEQQALKMVDTLHAQRNQPAA